VSALVERNGFAFEWADMGSIAPIRSLAAGFAGAEGRLNPNVAVTTDDVR